MKEEKRIFKKIILENKLVKCLDYKRWFNKVLSKYFDPEKQLYHQEILKSEHFWKTERFEQLPDTRKAKAHNLKTSWTIP